MELEGELNLYDVPLMALRPSTRQLIINELNKKKVLASEEGLPRDWRGLLHLTGLPTPSGENPACQVLAAWEKDPVASLGQLEQYLGQLDRWDIVDDVNLLIRADAKGFMSRMTDNPQENSVGVSDVDERVLTYDDITRLESGLQLQKYDALLLYADQDQSFATQMVDRLEEYNLKVCLKESLVGGLSFEHQGIMRLISERCRRVIIIVSRSFVNSPVNQFFVTFAQALAIEKRTRIIIPCMYERDTITLPMEIHYLHKLDYNRIGLKKYNFWEQLRDSVIDPPVLPSLRSSPVFIREIDNSSAQLFPVAQRAIEPSIEPVAKPLERVFKSGRTLENISSGPLTETKAMTKSSNNLLSLSENICSSSLSNGVQTLSCSSINLSEKHKTKSPKEFFRKLLHIDTKGAKKSKKTAVRL
uniref:TIR domain-containing protein n=1 Tax=Graphocephala atropunctata TaxID=36148 RepID=A0A1B6LXK5_9HEMI